MNMVINIPNNAPTIVSYREWILPSTLLCATKKAKNKLMLLLINLE